MKVRSISLFTSVAVMVLIVLSGCFMEGDTARVTINTGLGQEMAANELSLFDRLLALLHLSTPAMADPPPDPQIVLIQLSVSGPGMDTINHTVPVSTGKTTLDVPAGKKRRFTFVAWYQPVTGGAAVKQYGAIRTVDLRGGSSVKLTIQMGLLPDPPDILNSSGNYPAPVVFTWDYTTPPSNLVGFVVYRATASGGPYIPLIAGRKEDFDTGSNYQYTDNVEGFSQYDYIYYKIGANNQYGEGELSNYRTHYYC